ncbi:hypothetical protein TDB9533_03180 [Thalassocella blandensis]|nr:hypothetical protein TDB9533_03180 [Thalassocella blandensis]
MKSIVILTLLIFSFSVEAQDLPNFSEQLGKNEEIEAKINQIRQKTLQSSEAAYGMLVQQQGLNSEQSSKLRTLIDSTVQEASQVLSTQDLFTYWNTTFSEQFTESEKSEILKFIETDLGKKFVSSINLSDASLDNEMARRILEFGMETRKKYDKELKSIVEGNSK